MGVDLRLLPIDFYSDQDGKWWGYSHTILNLPRKSDAWYDIGAIKSKPLKGDLSIFAAHLPEDRGGDLGYGIINASTKDAYGDRYRYVTAEDLYPVLEKHFPGHPATAFVRASIGRNYTPTNLIVLDWH